MKKCPFCKTDIEDDSIFCDQCGKELKVCLACGSFARGKFCSNCRSTNIAFAKNMVDAVKPVNTINAVDAVNTNDTPKLSAAEKKTGSPTIADDAQVYHLIGVEKQASLALDGTKGNYIIGRKKGDFTDFFKDDSFVSRQHAQLTYDTEQKCWTIADLESTNGTFVNGTALSPNVSIPLKPGDMVRIAFLNFKLE